jgi:hypothetical protein
VPAADSTCAQCEAPLAVAARFCGKCGAVQPDPPVDERALARYRAVLASFFADGTLDAREEQQLDTLRQRLGVPLSAHQTLVAELAARATPASTSLALSVDVSTLRHFEVGSRCLVRLRVENCGELAIERLELAGEAHGEALATATAGTLFPGQSEVVALWLIPKVAGYQELSGEIHAVDLMEGRSSYRFEKIQFRVGRGSDAARVHVVNIDQSSARVVDNSRSSFGVGSAADGGLVAEGEWHPVPLRKVMAASAPSPSLTDEKGAKYDKVDFEVKTDRGAYRMTTTLARGDLATVFGGERRGDGAKVAVKLADDRLDNDLLQTEVRVLALLTEQESPQRKHLPVVLDQFRAPDGRLGTVLERLDGYDFYSLRDRLPDGVPQRHIIWILRRALSVLGWAHKNGILHGNIEPAHIFVRPRDHNVWLLDWCYAIERPAETGQTFRCLNEQYSPPEVAARRPPTPSSDLYSLGKSMIYVAGGDPATKELPASMDPRLQRFLKFFALESQLGRAQDPWDLYKQVDNLREEVFGPHEFLELEV